MTASRCRVDAAGPASISARMRAMAASEAGEDRLADQEVADVELDDFRHARRRRRDRVVGRAVAGMHLEARGRAPARHACEPRELARSAVGSPSSARLAVGAGVQLDHLGAEPARPPRSARGSGSMNSDTRMPASFSASTHGADGSAPRTTSSPPSVVRSSRFSGTRQQACGTCLQGDGSISLGRGHLEVERAGQLALSRAMSSSEMWRRSSRRCAVMPSAPASTARQRGAQRVGMRPPRALRMVATWSMLTPRRRCWTPEVGEELMPVKCALAGQLSIHGAEAGA